MCQSPRRGSLEIISGSMGSGKSSELMRRVQRALIARQRVQVLKSHLDDRYAGGLTAVSTHDGRTLPATPVRSSSDLLAAVDPAAEVVAIDEVQFFDDGIVAVVLTLAARGVRVICAGLDTTFTGAPFGPMGALLCVADAPTKLTAVCVRCGADATRTQRLIDGLPAPADSPIIQVGTLSCYEARCRACHEVPGLPVR